MEDTKKSEMWGKVMAPLAGFLAIVLVAFLIILKLLESGVIGTVMAMILICVIVAAVFGGIFMVIKSILDQIRSVINGKVSENTKVAEKAKKLADREDGIGEMVRSIETSVSSIELVLGESERLWMSSKGYPVISSRFSRKCRSRWIRRQMLSIRSPAIRCPRRLRRRI